MTAENIIDWGLDTMELDDLMALLVELETNRTELDAEIEAARAEIRDRLETGEAFEHVVKVDGEDRLGMTVRAQRTRGAHRWKYNPKQVMRRICQQNLKDVFLKETLDTKMFNQAMNSDSSMYNAFSDIVRSEYDEDGLTVTGLKELIKHRGLEK